MVNRRSSSCLGACAGADWPPPCRARCCRTAACVATALRAQTGCRVGAATPRRAMTVQIERLASAADLEAVMAIEEASFNNPTTRQWYENELQRPDVCFVYVVRTPDHPVAGFCSFWKVLDQIHINNLAIRPEMRRRGLARRLLTRVLEEAEALGAPHATL